MHPANSISHRQTLQCLAARFDWHKSSASRDLKIVSSSLMLGICFQLAININFLRMEGYYILAKGLYVLDKVFTTVIFRVMSFRT